MKALFWFVLGVSLALGGQAVAQFFDSYDNQGNHISGYQDAPNGLGMWNDSQGHSGTWYSTPAAPQPFIPRSPC
jgi:hypothetical protein